MPLIISGPGFQKNQVVTNLTSLLDLYVSGAPVGAGGDNGIDHHYKSRLRFTCVFIFSRSHDLPPPP
eukprot:COSAG01_NODE_2600_length_7396_cov_35.648212_6_plen_67_part_00